METLRRGLVLLPDRIATRYRLLVVDDDEGMRQNLTELFEGIGYEVLTASNTAEALRRMDGLAIDLLLTDYRLPGPTGLDLIEQVRLRLPSLPVILMTAYGTEFTEIESVRRGAIGYLPKPFEADEAMATVRRILALRRG